MRIQAGGAGNERARARVQVMLLQFAAGDINDRSAEGLLRRRQRWDGGRLLLRPSAADAVILDSRGDLCVSAPPLRSSLFLSGMGGGADRVKLLRTRYAASGLARHSCRKRGPSRGRCPAQRGVILLVPGGCSSGVQTQRATSANLRRI